MSIYYKSSLKKRTQHSTSHDLIITAVSEIRNVVLRYKFWRPENENFKLLHTRVVFELNVCTHDTHIYVYNIYTLYLVLSTVTPESLDIIYEHTRHYY